uniref:Putative ovule protein n=1 Tax=Solanum chacoense TaxID=4108 RepID=A0A0V0GJX6_SOLCH
MSQDIARTSLAIFLCQLVIFSHRVFELSSLSLASSFNSLSLNAISFVPLILHHQFLNGVYLLSFFLMLAYFSSRSISLCGGGLCFS